MNANTSRMTGRILRGGAVLGTIVLSAALLVPVAEAGGRDRDRDNGRGRDDDHRVVIKHVERHDDHDDWDHRYVTRERYEPRYSYRDNRGYHEGYRAPARFVVPRVIAREQLGYFSPYYQGTVYYAPHHHVHAVYWFPVYTSAGYVLQPNIYCGTGLYSTGAYISINRPGFSVSFGF